jgi:hypothetical protein
MSRRKIVKGAPAPEQTARQRAHCETEQHRQSVPGLLRLPRVRRLVLVAALIQGGHTVPKGRPKFACGRTKNLVFVGPMGSISAVGKAVRRSTCSFRGPTSNS